MTRPSTHPEINAYRRRTLIEAALDSVAELGLEGVTVRSIAVAAGVSPGLISHYFDGRDALLAAAHQHLCDLVEQAVRDQAAAGKLSALAVLDSIPATIFSEAVLNERNVRAFLAFWHAGATHAAIRATHERLYAGYRAQIADVLTRLESGGRLRVSARDGAMMLIALIDGLWLEMAMEKGVTREDAVRTCQTFIRQCLIDG